MPGTVSGMTDVSHDRQRLARVCERLRGASESSLVRPRDSLGGASAAAFVHELSTVAAQAMKAPTSVPLLHPLASADQLAVLGRELLDAVAGGAEPGALEAGLEQWRQGIELLRQAV